MELATKLMTSLSGNSIKNEALPSTATAPIQVSVSDVNSLPPSSPLKGGTKSENSEPIANADEQYTPASLIESQSDSDDVPASPEARSDDTTTDTRPGFIEHSLHFQIVLKSIVESRRVLGRPSTTEREVSLERHSSTHRDTITATSDSTAVAVGEVPGLEIITMLSGVMNSSSVIVDVSITDALDAAEVTALPAAEDDAPPKICAICYEDSSYSSYSKGSKSHLQGISHQHSHLRCLFDTICFDCLQAYFRNRIYNREKIECATCVAAREIPLTELQILTTIYDASGRNTAPLCNSFDLNNYKRFRAEHRRVVSKSVHCPHPDCEGYLPEDAVGGKFRTRKSTCLDCKNSYCYRCSKPWSAFHSCSKSSLSVWLWSMGRNIKTCPSCDIVIEKNGGCPHMTCRRCNHQFCWYCKCDWPHKGKIFRVTLCPLLGLVTSNWKFFGLDPITRTVTKTIVFGVVVAGAATAAVTGAAAVVSAPVTIPLYLLGTHINKEYKEYKRQKSLIRGPTTMSYVQSNARRRSTQAALRSAQLQLHET